MGMALSTVEIDLVTVAVEMAEENNPFVRYKGYLVQAVPRG